MNVIVTKFDFLKCIIFLLTNMNVLLPFLRTVHNNYQTNQFDYWLLFIVLASFHLQGILLVYDICSRSSFVDLSKWLNYIKQVRCYTLDCISQFVYHTSQNVKDMKKITFLCQCSILWLLYYRESFPNTVHLSCCHNQSYRRSAGSAGDIIVVQNTLGSPTLSDRRLGGFESSTGHFVWLS